MAKEEIKITEIKKADDFYFVSYSVILPFSITKVKMQIRESDLIDFIKHQQNNLNDFFTIYIQGNKTDFTYYLAINLKLVIKDYIEANS